MNAEKSEKIAQIIVLAGDDAIGREQARVKFENAIVTSAGATTIVRERFDPTRERFGTFAQRFMTPSLFPEVRIFHVNHAQTLSQSDLDELGNLLDFNIPDVYLIIEIDEEKRGKAESKTAKKLQLKKRTSGKNARVRYMEFIRPPDYKIAQWLLTQVPTLFDRTIAKNDAEYLVDLTGYDTVALYSELQKIDINLAPGAPIDRTIITEIVGASRKMTVFELATALGEKNFTRALEVIDSLFSVNFYAPMAVSVLFKYFWGLFRIRKFAETNPGVVKTFLTSKGFNNSAQNDAAFAIGKAAGLLGESDKRKVYPVIIASGVVQKARKFSDEALKRIFGWLLEFDIGVKTGRINADCRAVQLLCYKIVRADELLQESTIS